MSNQPLIGILAGMGPKSTGPFVDLVISEFQALTGAKNDIDFPPIMIYSLPTPFYVDRPIDHALLEKTICSGLQKLETCGAAFIAMPCNTAHLYFSALRQCIQVPLLNMVDITLAHIPHHAKKITLLGTRPTIESQVYQAGLDLANLSYVLDPGWQNNIDEILLSIKGSIDLRNAVCLWEKLSDKLLEAKIDTIVLACTDLNVVLKALCPPFCIIDASQCLARAVAETYRASA